MESSSLLTLSVSSARRVFALCILIVLAILCLRVAWLGDALSATERALWVAFSFVWIAGGHALWTGTRDGLELHEDHVSTSSGEILFRLDQIERVERGMLSFKPSNGMLMRLTISGKARWVPGLWWRFGRRVGIGGLTSQAATKAFAEKIEFQLALKNATS